MLFDFILVTVLSICLITDLKYQKIYNKIIFPSLCAAFLFHYIFNGYNGFKYSITGFGVGFFMLLIPYFLGGIGAGDVKLLGLIGALKGSYFVINTALYMALIGGVIALCIIFSHREFFMFIKGLFIWVYSLLHGIAYKVEFPTSVFLKKYPYGAAIAGGAVICLVFKGAWIV